MSSTVTHGHPTNAVASSNTAPYFAEKPKLSMPALENRDSDHIQVPHATTEPETEKEKRTQEETSIAV